MLEVVWISRLHLLSPTTILKMLGGTQLEVKQGSQSWEEVSSLWGKPVCSGSKTPSNSCDCLVGIGVGVDTSVSPDGAPFPAVEVSASVGIGGQISLSGVWSFEAADCFGGC